MNNENLVIGVVVEDHETLTVVEVCQKYSIPEELLTEMIEHGLFQSNTVENARLTTNDIKRINTAFRLHQELGINLPGVALALDLLKEIEAMQQELSILRRHF